MKYRLALVEYLNTLPFLEGIRINHLEDKLEIFRVPPATCAELFSAGKVDISLCPVGALSDMPPYEIRGRYGIGADGEVGTVVLLSKVPLDKIRSVRLDAHSRTSNILVQILAERFWKKNWDFVPDSPDADTESCLMIGDKVFARQDHYAYRYDLGAAWKALTGLPMIFAVWISAPGVPQALMQELDEAFETGIAYIRSSGHGLDERQREYLLHNISYPLDEAKRKAMHLYLEWAEALTIVPFTR